jgi:hypothetical protein
VLAKNWENCLRHPANPDRVRGANALTMNSKWYHQLNWPRGLSRKEAAMVLSRFVAIPSPMSSSSREGSFGCLGLRVANRSSPPGKDHAGSLAASSIACVSSVVPPKEKETGTPTQPAFPLARTRVIPTFPNPFVTPPEPLHGPVPWMSWDELGCEIAELPLLGIALSSPD